MVGRLNVQDLLCGVDPSEALVFVEPVPEPIAVQPYVRFVRPTVRAGIVVAEDALHAAFEMGPVLRDRGHSERLGRIDEPFVRPAGKGLQFAVAEKFRPLTGCRRVAVIVDAGFAQVGYIHFVVYRRIELFECCFIRNVAPYFDLRTARENRCLTGDCGVNHGGIRTSRTGCGYDPRRVHGVTSPVEKYRYRRAGSLGEQFGYALSRALRGAPGHGFRSGVVVPSFRRNVEFPGLRDRLRGLLYRGGFR